MKLRVFDIILKDILAYASRTDKYENEHVDILQRKMKILNQYWEKNVGQRFLCEIYSSHKNNGVASRPKTV